MSRSLVTIVTPSYNQADFLEETIVSVLEQDYPELEYAVVDGGSTDGSVEIIERYADRLAWWTSGPDGGQAAALNTAFALSRGELLGWINSDDTLLPGAVTRAAEALAARPDAVMAYGGVVHIDERSGEVGYHEPVAFSVEEIVGTWSHLVGQQGSLFRRSAYEQVGGLNEDRYYTFDAELFLRLACTGPLVPVPGRLATYRFHAESYSSSDPVRRAHDNARFVEDVFAWDGLPAHLRALEPQARAQAYLWSARLFYTGGEHALARRYYFKALRRKPALAASRVGLFARSLLPSGVRR